MAVREWCGGSWPALSQAARQAATGDLSRLTAGNHGLMGARQRGGWSIIADQGGSIIIDPPSPCPRRDSPSPIRAEERRTPGGAKPYGDRLESIGSISHLTDSNTGLRLAVAPKPRRFSASGARTRGECSQAARRTYACVGAFVAARAVSGWTLGFRPSTSPPSFTTLPRSACLGSSSDRGPFIRPGAGSSGARSPSRVRPPSFATPAASRRSARIAGCAAAALAAVRRKPSGPSRSHGSARWATTDRDATRGTLARGRRRPWPDGGRRLSTHGSTPPAARKPSFRKAGRLIRHDGPEHVFCFAPTRSGKGVGLVVPTLLSWPHCL
jgi:hypothetical protein